MSGQLLRTQLSSLRSLNDVREEVFPGGTRGHATAGTVSGCSFLRKVFAMEVLAGRQAGRQAN